MEERKQIIKAYQNRGMSISKATGLAGISRGSYYYQSRSGKPGRKPSTHTSLVDGTKWINSKLLELIKALLGLDFVDYGYIKVTHWLNQRGFCIDKKKVYRLMKENSLLCSSLKPAPSKEFVKYTRALPCKPFELLETDIKYIYVHGTGQNALLLTILDTFTREALVWKCQYSIRKTDVKELIEQLIMDYLQPYELLKEDITVTIRNDNGSQFIAKLVRECLRDNFIVQEFTRPGTPQQNGHIESFHSVIKRLVAEKYEFEGLNHLREVLKDFFRFYNLQRIHSSICYLSPEQFFWAWQQKLVRINKEEKHPRKRFQLLDMPVNIIKKYNLSNFAQSGEAEVGNAGEQPTRNSLTDGNDVGEGILPTSQILKL